MARLQQQYVNPGFYGIGIHNLVHDANIGTLWRSGYILGAAFIFTVGRPYRQQRGDVTHAWSKIPLYHYDDIDDLKKHLPHATRLIGVEMSEKACAIEHYNHPDRAIYLLGNEKSGLPRPVTDACHELIQLPGEFSLNVSVAGSLVLYDRVAKTGRALPQRADLRPKTT
ncbi:MAG TPA: TrmH family RNA methyltransferase [Candidatus Tenderia sp.]|nr:TrmH family RNA methyltransferase [Candidatus Tenderia sp.]